MLNETLALLLAVVVSEPPICIGSERHIAEAYGKNEPVIVVEEDRVRSHRVAMFDVSGSLPLLVLWLPWLSDMANSDCLETM